MALSHDAETNMDFTASTSFTHTPSAPPKAIWIGIAQEISNTDVITSVTYGGVTMDRVATNGFAQDTVTEFGAAYQYFLGSGIPTGPQTVSITVASGTDPKTAWVLSLAGVSDTQIVASGRVQENGTNPSVTTTTDSNYSGICVACFWWGGVPVSGISAGSG